MHRIGKKLKTKMKNLLILITFAMILPACNQNAGKDKTTAEKTVSIKKDNPQTVYNSDILEIENVLINGHQVILSANEFRSAYPKIDSSKTITADCGSPFDWLDEQWMTKTYGKYNETKGTFEKYDGKITMLYGENIEFSTNNHIVLFDMAFAGNNSFRIISHNITLDKSTTLEAFKRKFPHSKIEKLEKPDEARFRFYIDKEKENAFLFYFKNGKLDYFTLWWLLC